MRDVKIIEAISVVVETTKNTEAGIDNLLAIDTDLDHISGFFKCSKNEAFIIAALFVLNCQEGPISINELSKFLKCTTLRLLEQIPVIKELQEKDIVCAQRVRFKRNGILANMEYYLDEKIVDAIMNNTEIPVGKNKAQFDIFQMLENIYTLAEHREEGKLTTSDLLQDTEQYINKGANFNVVKQVNQLDLTTVEKYIIFYCYWKYLIGEDDVTLTEVFQAIYDRSHARIRQIQQFISGNSQLIRKGLIDMENGQFINEATVKLSEYSLAVLKDDGIQPYKKTAVKRDDHILPEQIVSKKLFYNEQEEKQLNLLGDALENSNFLKMQDRLNEKGLSKSIAVLLYGPPGTGKTESVYQFAKKTGRQILKVDISRTKSMWFGESQKLIKRVFSDYQSFKRSADKCPILLFNEADAVISTRRDSNSSNTAQTENAIQNIILEELENFNGILFATTNLVNNIDKAFERRFLFKIELKQPNISIRADIWRGKITHLTKDEAMKLANRYDFSGGQIDNILKKVEMSYILNDACSDIEQIINYCESEQLTKNRLAKVGFKTNQNKIETNEEYTDSVNFQIKPKP
jgi:hypothetical protein